MTARIFAFLILLFACVNAEAASRFMVLCVVSCTWDNSNTTIWSATSGGAGGQSAPVSGDTVTLDGSSGGGTATVNATLAMASLTTSAFTGTLDFSANNNSITFSSASAGWTDGATGVHTTNMGNGTWTFTTAFGTALAITASGNHTLNANGSTVLLSAVPTANRTVNLGKTFNNFTVTNAAWQPYQIDFANGGNPTISGAMTLTNVGQVRLATGGTFTVTGALTWDGSSANQGIIFTNGSPCTVSVGSVNVLSWLLIQNITKAGAGSITVNNGFDGGGNTGITINKPSGGVGRIIGGWLFDNDNQPMFLDKAV